MNLLSAPEFVDGQVDTGFIARNPQLLQPVQSSNRYAKERERDVHTIPYHTYKTGPPLSDRFWRQNGRTPVNRFDPIPDLTKK